MSNAMFFFVLTLVIEAAAIITTLITYGRAHRFDKAYVAALLVVVAVTFVLLGYAGLATWYGFAQRDADFVQASAWVIFINIIVITVLVWIGKTVDARDHRHHASNS